MDGNVVPLTLEGLTISNASGASVFAGGTAYPVSMGYKYDYGNCFDGGRDYCRLAGLKSPMATYSLLFGDKKVSDSSDEATKVEPVTIASISFQGKSNITKYEKYKQLYAQIKSRGYSEARIAKCGLAINKILRGMKILEDGPKNPLKFRLYLHGVARTMIKSGTSNLAELLKE